MSDLYIYYPFRSGSQGGVGVTDDADRHLRDRIEAVLFTAPGERVNRPDFGAGLNRFVFEGMDELSLAAVEFRVSQALRRDVGDEIIVDDIELTSDRGHGELILDIAFRRRTDRQLRHLEVRL